jgi:hypothetical protein
MAGALWGPRRMVVVFCLVFAAARSDAQAPSHGDSDSVAAPRYRYRIIGLYDGGTGTPIEGANVLDVLSGNSVNTTNTGTASLLFLPDGGGLVRIRKLGYGMQTMMVKISPADTNPLTIIMERATELPAFAVVDSTRRYLSPNLRTFEEHRHNATSGYFLNEAQLRTAESRGQSIASALMSGMPGIQVSESPGKTTVTRSPRCARGGAPAVYLDGVELVDHDISGFPPSMLAGIEYYPNNANAPVEYMRTTRSCGALVLWSRQ